MTIYRQLLGLIKQIFLLRDEYVVLQQIFYPEKKWPVSEAMTKRNFFIIPFIYHFAIQRGSILFSEENKNIFYDELKKFIALRKRMGAAYLNWILPKAKSEDEEAIFSRDAELMLARLSYRLLEAIYAGQGKDFDNQLFDENGEPYPVFPLTEADKKLTQEELQKKLLPMQKALLLESTLEDHGLLVTNFDVDPNNPSLIHGTYVDIDKNKYDFTYDTEKETLKIQSEGETREISRNELDQDLSRYEQLQVQELQEKRIVKADWDAKVQGGAKGETGVEIPTGAKIEDILIERAQVPGRGAPGRRTITSGRVPTTTETTPAVPAGARLNTDLTAREAAKERLESRKKGYSSDDSEGVEIPPAPQPVGAEGTESDQGTRRAEGSKNGPGIGFWAPFLSATGAGAFSLFM